MHITYLSLGSNLGSKLQNLQAAANLLSNSGQFKALSGVYTTAAWGKSDQPTFYNIAAEYHTDLGANQLLTLISEVESNLGRIRKEKWGERLIDIDILYYDNEVVNTQKLTIPHPEIENRRFVLQPMAEIAPNLMHARLNQTQTSLLKNCLDLLEVAYIGPFTII